MRKLKQNTGFSLIEVLASIAIVVTVFTAVFGVLQTTFILTESVKKASSGLALATEQLESVRSLPYDDVGTISGIPTGNIPQNATTTLNGIEYNIRTLIQYVDAPQDGLGVADTNAITADYKVVKVEVSWDVRGQYREVELISNIVPRGIETLAGGGTLTVNVIDALGAPVSNADVRIINDTTAPTIDVTSATNVAGVVTFPGAPAASDYEIVVSKTAYSGAQTYDATGALPNPNPGHVSVIAGDTTSTTFAIDQHSSKTVRTFEPVSSVTFSDTFVSGANLSSTSAGIQVTGGQVQLLDPGSGFSTATETAYSIDIIPTSLVAWTEFAFNYATSASTSVLFHLYHDNGSSDPVLVSDVDLPGNSTGFVDSPIDLTSLSTTTYDDLYLMAELITIDNAITPAVLDWDLTYDDGPVPLPNITFDMIGTKTIGTDGGAAPVFKFDESMTTDGSGVIATTTLEWDTYTITVSGYDITSMCDAQPRVIAPNEVVTTDIILDTSTSHNLLVQVLDDNSDPLNGASVRLHRAAGYDTTITTSGCGQAFFANVPEGTTGAGNAYTLDTTATGFTADNTTDVEVSGVSNETITLFP